MILYINFLMGIIYSIKIHKPIYLQTNSVHLRPISNISNLSANILTNNNQINLINRTQINNNMIVSAFINRSFNHKNNEELTPIISMLSTKKSYRLILIFIPHTKIISDYDDLCTSLISHDQVVVICRFDKDMTTNISISNLDTINKLLTSIKDR